MADGAAAGGTGRSGPLPRRPLKVLFLSAAGLVGGAERSLYELLCALPEERVEAHACLPPEGHLARLFTLAEVPVHPAPLRRFRRTLHPFLLAGQIRALFRTSRMIGGLARELGVDVLHANTDSAALVAWEIHRETRCPFVWHCRDLRPLGPLTKILAHSSARVVAISQAVARHLLSQGVPGEKLRVIENGIDRARFHGAEAREAIRTRTRRYLGVGPQTPLLIDIGAWVPWKRHELFIEALAAVRRSCPKAVGLLVGSDLFRQNLSYAQSLDARMEQLALDDGALLVLQQREDVPDLLAAADVLLAPSDQEPFGRVLAEAGAAGVPVVATDSGGKAEIIAHGETGYLTPPGQAAPLAEACLELIQDSKKRRAMGEAARARVARCFDVKRTAREAAELYEELVATPKDPAPARAV